MPEVIAVPKISLEDAQRLVRAIKPETLTLVNGWLKNRREKKITFEITTKLRAPEDYVGAILTLAREVDPRIEIRIVAKQVLATGPEGTRYSIELSKNKALLGDVFAPSPPRVPAPPTLDAAKKAVQHLCDALKQGRAPEVWRFPIEEDLPGDYYIDCGAPGLAKQLYSTFAPTAGVEIFLSDSRLYISRPRRPIAAPPMEEAARGPKEVWWGLIPASAIQRRVDELISAGALSGKGTELYTCTPARLFAIVENGKVTMVGYSVFGAPLPECRTPIGRFKILAPEIGRPYVIPPSYYYEYAPLIVRYGLHVDGVRIGNTVKLTRIEVDPEFIDKFAPLLKGKDGVRLGYDSAGKVIAAHIDPRYFAQLKEVIGREGFNVELSPMNVVTAMSADYASPYNLPGFWKIRLQYYDEQGNVISGAYLFHVAGTLRDAAWPYITPETERTAVEGILKRGIERQYSHGCCRTADHRPFLLDLADPRAQGDWFPYRKEVTRPAPEGLVLRLKDSSGTVTLRNLANVSEGWVGWAFFKGNMPIGEEEVNPIVEIEGKRYRFVWIGNSPEDSPIFQKLKAAVGSWGVSDYAPSYIAKVGDKIVITAFRDEYEVYAGDKKYQFAAYIIERVRALGGEIPPHKVWELISEAQRKGVATTSV